MKYFDRLLIAPSEQRFARVIMRELQAAGDTRQATFDSRTFQLHFYLSDKSVGRANLKNLYDEFVSKPFRSRRGFLKSTVRSLLASHKSPPSDFEAARHDVLLSLRNRSYYSRTEMQNWLDGRPDFAWPHSPIAEHLAVGLVYDLPEAMIMLQRDQLEAWGISYYEAVEAAQNNLAELEAAFASIENRIYVSTTEDHYDSSRMLVPELIRELEISGDPIAIVPNRDSLLITGSHDADGLQLLANVARESLKQPRPMCGVAFCLRGDEWTPWLPAKSHPAAEPLGALYVESVARDYADQQPTLQQWCSEEGDDAVVADFRVFQGRRPRQLHSFCIWPRDQDCLLPRTDRVFFDVKNRSTSQRSRDLPNASWEVVEEAFGDRLIAEDVFPPRYRVREFPSARQLASICRG